MADVNTKLGRDALLDAAAALFDEHGVDAVSVNRITEASGHRNRSAASYHLGGKYEIVEALALRGMERPDRRRSALLDELEARAPEPPIQAVVDVLLRPMTEELDDLAGRRHLRLLGQLVGHPIYNGSSRDALRANPSLARCAVHLVVPLLDLPEDIRQERGSLLAPIITRAYADQARLLDVEDPPRRPLPADRFTANLADLLLALLHAPWTPTDGKT